MITVDECKRKIAVLLCSLCLFYFHIVLLFFLYCRHLILTTFFVYLTCFGSWPPSSEYTRPYKSNQKSAKNLKKNSEIISTMITKWACPSIQKGSVTVTNTVEQDHQSWDTACNCVKCVSCIPEQTENYWQRWADFAHDLWGQCCQVYCHVPLQMTHHR